MSALRLRLQSLSTLSPLQKAALAADLLAAEKPGLADGLNPKQRVASKMGMQVCQFNRYLAILKAPPEVQEAVESGKLRLIDARKVQGYGVAVRQRIVERLKAGESPATAIALEVDPPRRKNFGVTVRRLLRHFDDTLPYLELDAVRDAPPSIVARLEEGYAQIGELLAKLKSLPRKRAGV